MKLKRNLAMHFFFQLVWLAVLSTFKLQAISHNPKWRRHTWDIPEQFESKLGMTLEVSSIKKSTFVPCHSICVIQMYGSECHQTAFIIHIKWIWEWCTSSAGSDVFLTFIRHQKAVEEDWSSKQTILLNTICAHPVCANFLTTFFNIKHQEFLQDKPSHCISGG